MSYEGVPTINASAIIVAEENVAITRIVVDSDAVLDVAIVVDNAMDLPLAGGHSEHALTMQRDANSWIENAAVLLECDAYV